MKELSKTNRLTIVVVAIVLVFVAGLLTLRQPDIRFKLSPAQSVELLNDNSNSVTTEMAKTLLTANDGKTIFVDVRNSVAFDRGHVQDARNIPVRELFSKDNIAFFRELEKNGQTALIYGETPQQANGPWMMLKQLGLNNILVYEGTFHQINPTAEDSASDQVSLLNEVPVIDTAALRKLTAPDLTAENAVAKTKPVQKVIMPARTAPTSGGGC